MLERRRALDHTSLCDADCTPAQCGDGVLNLKAGEQCETPGHDTSDCDAGDCTPVVCGDGYANAAAHEECDDGNTLDSDACLSSCVAARCGDQIVWIGAEACDDGNTVDADGCSNRCGISLCLGDCGECGDGVVDPGEACDDGNADDTDGCTAACALSTCGNSLADPGEWCDGGGCCTARCLPRPDGEVCDPYKGSRCNGVSGACATTLPDDLVTYSQLCAP